MLAPLADDPVFALGRAATQRRPHRGHQIRFAEAVPFLQPHEDCDGLLPHLSICGAERLSAQRRHPQCRASFDLRVAL